MQASQITTFLIITTALIFLLATLIVALLYSYGKKQIVFEQNVNKLKLDFEKNLLKTQVEIQEQTFQNISREIHDNINLSLTLAKLNLNTLNWENKEVLANSIKSSIGIIGSAISDLSNLSRSMNPELIRSLGLIRAIRNEVERMQTLAHIEVELDVTGETTFMDCEKELVLFRIIQEGFNNIIKHAQASKIWLLLNYAEDYLEISIRDNGIGFETGQVAGEKNLMGSGLTNIYTRASLFGGKVAINSYPHQGSHLLITVPY